MALGRHLDRLIPGAAVWVAANREDSDRVLGWVCADPSRSLLHWAWTREAWRRAGIASALVGMVTSESRGPLAVTGWSQLGAGLFRSLSSALRPWPDCYRPDLGR